MQRSRDAESKIITEDGMNTLPQVLMRNARLYGKRTSIRKKDFGIWQEYTWEQYFEIVKYFSLGLVSLGMERGGRVALLSDCNDPNWWWAEVAAQAAGGIAVGIYSDCVPQEVKYIIEHSDASFVVAQDQEQCDKILEIKDSLPLVKKLIYWDPKGMWHYKDPLLLKWEEVIKLGKAVADTHPKLFEENVAQGKEEDIALFNYTSGTTGLPKGAMIPHRMYIEVAEGMRNFQLLSGNDEYVCSGSSGSIVEQQYGIGLHLVLASIANFVEEPETLQNDIREIGPAIFFTWPREWERIISDIEAKMQDAFLLGRYIYKASVAIGRKTVKLRQQGIQPNFLIRILHGVLEFLCLRPLRDRIGLRNVRMSFTGGSFTGPDVFEFINALNINLRNVYGLTEVFSPIAHSIESMSSEHGGRLRPGIEAKVSEDGEILFRGRNVFTGYHKNREETKKALDEEGWFHTGDAAFFDDGGNFHYLDRVKEMAKLRNGKIFSPTYIESRLKFSPYIKDAMVVGTGRDFVAAILNIDREIVGRWAEKNHISYTTYTDLSQKAEIYSLVSDEVKKINPRLPKEFQIKRFVNLYKEFDADEGELTRTRKLKRISLEDRFKDIISALYSGETSVNVQGEIKYRDGRKGSVSTALYVQSLDTGEGVD